MVNHLNHSSRYFTNNEMGYISMKIKKNKLDIASKTVNNLKYLL